MKRPTHVRIVTTLAAREPIIGWHSVYAPAGTAIEILARLNAELVKVIKTSPPPLWRALQTGLRACDLLVCGGQAQAILLMRPSESTRRRPKPIGQSRGVKSEMRVEGWP
jgi:hypothetical protein